MSLQSVSGSARIEIEAVSTAIPAANALKRYLTERGFTNTVLNEDACDAALEILFSKPSLYPQIVFDAKKEDAFCVRSLQTSVHTVVLLASNSAGFFAAAGALLSGIRFHADGHIEIQHFDIGSSPRMSYRASLFSVHLQDHCFKNWSEDQFHSYMEDMALWGANVGMSIMMHFSQRSRKCFEENTPEAKHWERSGRFPDIVSRMGLTVGTFCGHNDVFLEDVHELKNAQDGAGDTLWASTENSVCPSHPGARERILQRRRELFSRADRIDAIYLPYSDYGGCACPDCQPYANTYLSLCKDIAACLREYHPDAKVYISMQMMTREGVLDYLIPYLNSSESDWVSGIVYAVHATELTLPEFRALLPANRYQILLYPEITMIDGWGQIGAVPWVKRITYSIERSVDMAAYCTAVGGWGNPASCMFSAEAPIGYDCETMYDMVDGAFTYSEGLHDDIAKYIWLRYCWDPTGDRAGYLRDYCRLYFGEKAAETAAEAIKLMEEITYQRAQLTFCPPLTGNDDGTGKEKSRTVKMKIDEMTALMPAWARESWRYKMLALRAGIDYAAFRAPDEVITQAEKDGILLLAKNIYEQTGHLTVIADRYHFDADRHWNQQEALEDLDKLLYPPEELQIKAPISQADV